MSWASISDREDCPCLGMGSMSTERSHSTESTKSSSNTTGNAADTITAAAAAVLNGQSTPGSSSLVMGKTTSVGNYHLEETPNHLVYRKMEQIIERMQDDAAGVPVRTVKTFMNKIPSVFSGNDLVLWMIKNLDVTDQMEALHLAHLVAAHGYFFPVEDHVLTVKNDGTLYRFQTPYFWPSNCWEPENTDYAVYLCKRTMQNKARLELADYEAENLARLQKMFSRKWEFIFMQAEAQSRVDKKRDKLERKVLDSQERAFWDVHRPVPGCVNTTEMDIKKACRMHRPIKSTRHLSIGVAGGRVSPSLGDQDPEGNPIILAQKEIEGLRKRLARTNTKVSKVAESFISYFEQYVEYDPFLTPSDPLNPWVSDTVDFWEQDKQGKEIQAKRVKRWGFSLQELLKDPVGHEHFVKFLEKEFSSENLKLRRIDSTGRITHYEKTKDYVSISWQNDKFNALDWTLAQTHEFEDSRHSLTRYRRFWEAVQRLKMLPQSQVVYRGRDIWAEFLASDATCPVNVDSKSHEATRIAMENPDRWTFDRAVAHVYHLMRSDSYSRYLRSEMYKEILSGSRKKSSMKSIRAIVPFSSKKEPAAY